MATKRAMLFFDGACRGNGTRHAKAGAGYALHVDGRCVASGHTFLGAVSNNVAEYAGLLAGMRLARALAVTHLAVRGDSQLVVRQMTGEYAAKHPDMARMRRKCMAEHARFTAVSYTHVFRIDNKDADSMANKAVDTGNFGLTAPPGTLAALDESIFKGALLP